MFNNIVIINNNFNNIIIRTIIITDYSLFFYHKSIVINTFPNNCLYVTPPSPIKDNGKPQTWHHDNGSYGPFPQQYERPEYISKYIGTFSLNKITDVIEEKAQCDWYKVKCLPNKTMRWTKATFLKKKQEIEEGHETKARQANPDSFETAI